MKTLEELGFELEIDYHYIVYKTKNEDVIVFLDEGEKTPASKQIGIEIYFDGSEVYTYEELWYPTKQEIKRYPAMLDGETVLAIANKVKELKEITTHE